MRREYVYEARVNQFLEKRLFRDSVIASYVRSGDGAPPRVLSAFRLYWAAAAFEAAALSMGFAAATALASSSWCWAASIADWGTCPGLARTPFANPGP